jgi:hypothetical protein
MISARRRFLSGAMALGLAFAAAACGDDGSGPDLAPPTGLTAGASGPSSITVAWTASGGAAGYIVQRAPGATNDYVTVGTPAEASYDDAGLTPSTAYRYRVAAVRGNDTTAWAGPASAQTGAPGTRALSADITASRRLDSDTVYTLTAFVHVTNGATLTIEPGTRVEGNPGSALFIMPGAKIDAAGTAEKPIVLTSSQAVGSRRPGDWGGLIIVGRGVINRTGTVELEGTGLGGENNFAVNYNGGTDNNDDSGRLSYVRIEFAGFGPSPDRELNALTLAAVGSGTDIDHVQTLAGLDDSFEWFGGAVSAKYLVSYISGDDHFDAAEGYIGLNQFLIALQDTVLTQRAGSGNISNDPQGFEVDGCNGTGCTSGQNSTPLNIPLFANFTVVGRRSTVSTPDAGGRGMVLRRGTGGYYVNGAVVRWSNSAVSLRDAATQSRITEGNLVLRNILAAQVPALQENTGITVDAAANALVLDAAATTTTLFQTFAAVPTSAASLDWTPAANSPLATGGLNTFPADLQAKAAGFVTPTSYRGAADPAGADWWAGWTSFAHN